MGVLSTAHLLTSPDTEKCVGCNLCTNTCDFQKANGVDRNYPIKSYAAVNKNAEILKHSSSGGVFSALAVDIINDSGAVFGCVFDEKFNPVHICADNLSKIEKMRGSKYVQSDIGFSYREVKRRLQDGQKVLFTGTPCQIAALYSFLGKKDDNLLTVDLICHGVPSSAMFHQYLSHIENKYNSKIDDYQFRSKAHGWGNYIQLIRLNYFGKIKKKEIGSNDEFYLPNFRKGNLNRPSCYYCKYACAERVGDITMGDFWGYQKAEIKMKTNHGLSSCLINSSHGESYSSVIESNMNTEPVETNIIIQGNGQLKAPMKLGNQWNYYMEAFKNNEINAAAEKYIQHNKKNILKQRLIDFLPQPIFIFLLSVKHLLKGLGKKDETIQK